MPFCGCSHISRRGRLKCFLFLFALGFLLFERGIPDELRIRSEKQNKKSPFPSYVRNLRVEGRPQSQEPVRGNVWFSLSPKHKQGKTQKAANKNHPGRSVPYSPWSEKGFTPLPCGKRSKGSVVDRDRERCTLPCTSQTPGLPVGPRTRSARGEHCLPDGQASRPEASRPGTQ